MDSLSQFVEIFKIPPRYMPCVAYKFQMAHLHLCNIVKDLSNELLNFMSCIFCPQKVQSVKHKKVKNKLAVMS